jgi:hypothetical protein
MLAHTAAGGQPANGAVEWGASEGAGMAMTYFPPPPGGGLPPQVLDAATSLANQIMPSTPPTVGAGKPASLVVGVGVGRVRDNGLAPPSYFLGVYVTDENASDQVPSTHHGLPVQTEVTGMLVPAALPGPAPVIRLTPARPVAGGVSVEHAAGGSLGAGTLGCLVRDAVQESIVCILSNNHVLARGNQWPAGHPQNKAQAGDDILQPGIGDGGISPADVLARLFRWVPLQHGGGYTNGADAAIAELVYNVDAHPFILQVGEVRSALNLTTLPNGPSNLPVRKMGRSTRHTTGEIHLFPTKMLVQYPGAPALTGFQNQLSIRPAAGQAVFARHGDSGAVVLDAENRAVGLLYAVATQSNLAFASPMTDVAALLSVKLWQLDW